MARKYEIYHIDTCTPSYFSGHHLPVIQVPVTRGTTYQDIKDYMLSYEATEHLEDTIDYEAYRQAVEVLFDLSVDDLSDVPTTCGMIDPVDDEDGYSEGVYFFFDLEECEEE